MPRSWISQSQQSEKSRTSRERSPWVARLVADHLVRTPDDCLMSAGPRRLSATTSARADLVGIAGHDHNYDAQPGSVRSRMMRPARVNRAESARAEMVVRPRV